ncbi:DUF3081 family protein [Colwellia sp. Bg11-12]|uniref:DUF3081 family protein n=1 Tax=Colwellia sp. Bg11-12 TaxID=2759817 RepID=UPI0015F71210|nr:DUF3081 family protein [Colwellia sp. Bg11-12]MBA6262622.1 DUF3081 family protein [Colwellia sp. Bg11-12]
MKDRQLTLREFLEIYDFITKEGIKLDGMYEHSGIKAWHDFDGYTCWLGYKDLTITLLFHGRFSIEYEHKDTLESFHKIANKFTVNN